MFLFLGQSFDGDESNMAIMKEALAAIREPDRKADPIDGFLTRLGEGLRLLPYRERSELEIKFLSQLLETQDMLNLL